MSPLICSLLNSSLVVQQGREYASCPKGHSRSLTTYLKNSTLYFPDGAADNLIYIIVEVPKRVSKRDRDQLEDGEGDRSSSKKTKLDEDNLMRAISAAGLAQKAIINGDPDLSVLTSKELVSLLANNGARVSRTDLHYSIFRTATSLQNGSFQELDVISSPLGTKLPVINMKDLYVRSAFKELYDTIVKGLYINGDDKGPAADKIVVTGTADIGKSSFLVYFAIRMLATSNVEDPPIIIIQRKESSKCYAFGGRSVVRYGDIEDFRPFLDLPSTWFLVDGPPTPLLTEARTIFSVSPKTFHDKNPYKDIEKRVEWKYYMAPWELDELKECRSKVEAFQMVPEDFMEHLYDLIGGVPRYVLEVPQKGLRRYPAEDRCKEEVRAKIEMSTLDRIQQALVNMKILQHFEQAKNSLWYSSRLLYRYPTEDHDRFKLVWASNYIMEKVYDAADDNTWNEILNRLANGKVGEDRGAMFELYMRRILRIGNRCFQARNLDDNTEITIDIKARPDVKWFNTLECYKDKMQGSLWIPNSKRFACVDMLLAPNYLLQVTTNKDHGIKSKPFKAFLKSMRENKWIHSSEEVALIFVVPQDQIKEFMKQNFKTGTNRVDSKATKELLDVKQYIMGIDLQAELRHMRTRTER